MILGRLFRWWDRITLARHRARMKRKRVLMPNDLIVHKPFHDSRSSLEQFRRIVGPRTNRPFASRRTSV